MHPATVGSRDRLAFSRKGADTHLYRFNAALPDERIAASSSVESDPHFSPDGRRLAFSSGRSGGFAVWVAAADGSGAQQLTHGIEGGWGGSPSWAPDGHTIAFDESDPPDAHSHIWTVDAEGGAIRQITNGCERSNGPDVVGRRALDLLLRPSRARPRHLAHSGGWWTVAAGDAGGSGYLGIESFDGAGLLYQPKPEEDSALLLQPLSGGSAAPSCRLCQIRCLCHCGTNDLLRVVRTRLDAVASHPRRGHRAGSNPRPTRTLSTSPVPRQHCGVAGSTDGDLQGVRPCRRRSDDDRELPVKVPSSPAEPDDEAVVQESRAISVAGALVPPKAIAAE